MEVRITKTRAAMAALFVLAGIGLGSLLSPLVGSALANVGQVVNISDHSASAYFAKVDSSGALKTTAVVSGRVAPALPPQPFYVARFVDVGASFVPALGPTTATVALTDLKLGNDFRNQGRRLALFEYSAPAPNTSCTNPRLRFLGYYDVGSAQTLDVSFQTPPVLKPLAGGDAWCLTVNLTAPAGDPNYFDSLALGGYVLAGTFTPPAAPPSAKLRAVMRRR
jgi:hypothetical protein